MTDRKVRLGIVGAGWWGTSNHIPILKEREKDIGDVELVGVCRLGKKELKMVQDRFDIKLGTEDYRDMFDWDLDGIIIATPHECHYEQAKASLEHGLILESGAYDVTARLLPENLHVDDGWVVRKNPQAIVKIVDSSVLGGSIGNPAAAEAVFQALLKREGWAGINAIRDRQIVLISRELLEAPHLRTAAMLIVAKTCVPSLFEDVDTDRALQMLMEEAAGTLPTGVYYYPAPK